MSMVQGEDSESDEEFNPEQIHALTLTPDGSLTTVPPDTRGKGAGIVAGEESETDEEDDVNGAPEQTDVRLVPPTQTASVSPGQSQHSSVESGTPPPQSLLHKKLRETNLDLRRRIVNRILRLYRVTCHNLTTVNDNLSKAQGVAEKVNSQLKQSDKDLEQLNTTLSAVNSDSLSFAPNIHINVPSTSSGRRQLFKRSPDRPRASPTAVTNLSHETN